MVLQLWRGTTCLRTIYNVLKVNQDDVSHILVKNINTLDHEVTYKTYHFKKDYERFIISVD